MIGSNGSNTTWYWAAILLGLLPVWMVLLPLDITGDPSGWQVFVRSNSLAVPLIELIFVLLVMSGSFSPLKAARQLPHMTKIALGVWLALSCAVSFQPTRDHLLATIGLTKLVLTAMFFLAMIDLKRSFDLRFLIMLWVSLGIGTTLYIPLWIIHIWIVSPQGDDWIYRMPGVNNVRHIGHFAFASVIAGLVTSLAFRDSNKASLRWLLPLVFGAGGLGVSLWTGSRGPLFASLVAMLVTFFVAEGSRKTLIIFCVSSALAAVAIVATLPVPHPLFGMLRAIGMADVTAPTSFEFSSGRTVIWSQTIEKILEHPVLGWGINQYAPFGPVGAFHPHNFPLQLMFSGGIVSVILILMVFFPALRRWKWPCNHGVGAAGIGGVIGILFYSMYDGALYFSYPIMIFLIAIATSVATSASNTDESSDKLFKKSS